MTTSESNVAMLGIQTTEWILPTFILTNKQQWMPTLMVQLKVKIIQKLLKLHTMPHFMIIRPKQLMFKALMVVYNLATIYPIMIMMV